VNIIPRECTFAWEYRALPGGDTDEIARRFEAHCVEEITPEMQQRAAEAGVVNRVRSGAPGLLMRSGAAEETLVLGLAEKNTTGAVSYATEGGLFQEADIPTYVCGPGDIAQAHKPDEFVERADLRLCERFLQRVIAHLC
jgi:acetylornithine deacetylase